jgi:diguanylate cyclase (GGDEF)-like protein
MAQQRLQLAVLFVAVDLNVINDSMGHTAGDSIMTEFAGRLEGLLRPGDLAGHFGGNEFVVVCEDIASEKEASAVAARLLDLLREPFQVGLIPLTVSASVGVIVAGANDDAETLLRDADAAMDQARESGRNQYALFESGIRLRAVARLETEELLRLAIDRSELELLYQPIVRLSDERVVAVEALLRWNHPQRGLVGPDQFIPLLEQTGLIIPVGSWVIAEACRQAERWCQFAGDEPPVGMHVNVSVHQLTHPALFDAVYEGLRSTSTDPARLTLEVTESMLMRDTETYLESFLGLKAHAGVKLAIDDFGTGYSPLGYLRDFPTDCLKIDKSFVQQLAGRKRGSEAIVGAVVGMANAMGITAVAEGVETEAQLGALRALGCGFAQGYRYSPPVPAEAIDVLLREASGWRAR